MTLRRNPCGPLLALSIAMTAGIASATMVLPQNLEQLESRSQLIFVGVCTGRTGTINDQGLPVSIYTFEVKEAVKGGLRAKSRVEFRQFGNGVPGPNGVMMRIEGIPDYQVGQELLLFLAPPSQVGLTAPVGLWQGAFPVVRDAKGNRQIFLNALARKHLTAGIDMAKYETNRRFTPSDRELLSSPPGRVDVAGFCSLVGKMVQQREQAEKPAENQ